MHSNKRDEIKEVRAGDIAAAIGLKDVTTGDTLWDQNHKVILERMESLIRLFKLRSSSPAADQEKMGIALGKLAAEDPSSELKRTMKRSNTDLWYG